MPAGCASAGGIGRTWTSWKATRFASSSRSSYGTLLPPAWCRTSPYNITSPLVFAFLELEPPADRIVLTVQREVADRIAAPPGIKAYGALSVGVQAVADASLAFRVGRQAFRPVPSVDSAVVRLEPRPDAVGADPAALRTLTRACFNRRRKQLQKTLRTAPELRFAGDVDALLARLSIDPAARPETLDPPTFVRLAEALLGRPGGGASR